jgi:hypothetical protein
VFNQQQQLLLRCTLQALEADRHHPAPAVLTIPETLPAHLTPLAHTLVQVCTGRAAPRQ